MIFLFAETETWRADGYGWIGELLLLDIVVPIDWFGELARCNQGTIRIRDVVAGHETLLSSWMNLVAVWNAGYQCYH